MAHGARPRPRPTPKDCHVAVPTVDAYGDRWVVVAGLDYLTKTDAVVRASQYPTRARACRVRDGYSTVLYDNYRGAEIPSPPKTEARNG
jgi:hypothetical protein